MSGGHDERMSPPELERAIVEFNLCGQICPATLLIALKEINANQEQLRWGRVDLIFKTDNRDATVTIPEAARNMGYEVHVTENGPCYDIVVNAATERDA